MRATILHATFAILAFSSIQASATLVAIDSNSLADPGSVLSDLDTGTGTSSLPRSTFQTRLSALTSDPTTNVLYGLSNGAGFPAASSLVTINTDTGVTTVIGSTGLDIVEGGLAFDPISGDLYGINSIGAGGDWSVRTLFRIDATTGAATIIGPVGGDRDYSTLAFDSSGTLFTIDSLDGTNSLLHTIDTTNGSLLTTTTLDIDVGVTAGMAFDPDTGVAYLVESNTNSLFTLDTTTGGTTLIGPTGITRLSGLAFVPEPSSAILFVLGAVGFLGRRRR